MNKFNSLVDLHRKIKPLVEEITQPEEEEGLQEPQNPAEVLSPVLLDLFSKHQDKFDLVYEGYVLQKMLSVKSSFGATSMYITDSPKSSNEVLVYLGKETLGSLPKEIFETVLASYLEFQNRR